MPTFFSELLCSSRVATSGPGQALVAARFHAALRQCSYTATGSAHHRRSVGIAQLPGGPSHRRRRLPSTRSSAHAMAAAGASTGLKPALLVIDMQVDCVFCMASDPTRQPVNGLPHLAASATSCSASCVLETRTLLTCRLAPPVHCRTTFACQAPCCAWRVPWAACPRWWKPWMWRGQRVCPSSG